jgi:predicted nucleic acid-binding Zn ribbon protein
MGRPRALGQMMNATLREFGMEEKARKYTILSTWPEIVGEKVAEVTTPEKLDKGVLSVKVTNAVWRYELTMRKTEILSKLHRHFGINEVKDIHWK